MRKSQVKQGIFVRNKKYGTIEYVLGKGKMKLPDGTWTESVIYKGKDRNTGKQTYFAKSIGEFAREFEFTLDDAVAGLNLTTLTLSITERNFITSLLDEFAMYNNDNSSYKRLCDLFNFTDKKVMRLIDKMLNQNYEDE